ncbi:MAG TPA: energy transducer TonB [Gemmatimonadales bacterium]
MPGTSSPHAPFDAYRLPLPRRRQGSAATLSLIAHVAIAVAVLWRGAALFQPGAGDAGPPGGGGGGRPAVSWFTLPTPSIPLALDVPPPPRAPRAVIVPATALPDPIKLDVSPLQMAPPLPQRPPLAAGTGAGAGGGPGMATGTGTAADAGPGSRGDGGYIPAFARGGVSVPECARGDFQLRFWVEVDGRVSRVEVDPSPTDARCQRETLAQMRAYRFRPATRDGRPVASVYQIRLIH